jgi:3-methyladenine DNA glycosylase/8-oxoguanine DNA glycosylase
MSALTWDPQGPLDLRTTLGGVGHGGGDPTWGQDADGSTWWATWTPDGPGTLRLARGRVGDQGAQVVHADAWGAGAGWLLSGVPELLGAADDRAGFEPARHPLVAQLDHRFPGLRVPRTRRVLEAAISAALSQKVTGREAFQSWRTLVHRYGSAPPGPADPTVARSDVFAHLVVPPAPKVWRTLSQHDLMSAGVTPARVRVVQAVARVWDALERTATDRRPFDAVDVALRSIPGVGPWTSAEIRQRAHGDPDAISVGDYHLANDICWALTGEQGHRGDDETMLALVQPWARHRFRVQRLLEVAHLHAPRRGPRYSPPDHRPRRGWPTPSTP